MLAASERSTGTEVIALDASQPRIQFDAHVQMAVKAAREGHTQVLDIVLLSPDIAEAKEQLMEYERQVSEIYIRMVVCKFHEEFIIKQTTLLRAVIRAGFFDVTAFEEAMNKFSREKINFHLEEAKREINEEGGRFNLDGYTFDKNVDPRYEAYILNGIREQLTRASESDLYRYDNLDVVDEFLTRKSEESVAYFQEYNALGSKATLLAQSRGDFQAKRADIQRDRERKRLAFRHLLTVDIGVLTPIYQRAATDDGLFEEIIGVDLSPNEREIETGKTLLQCAVEALRTEVTELLLRKYLASPFLSDYLEESRQSAFSAAAEKVLTTRGPLDREILGLIVEQTKNWTVEQLIPFDFRPLHGEQLVDGQHVDWEQLRRAREQFKRLKEHLDAYATKIQDGATSSWFKRMRKKYFHFVERVDEWNQQYSDLLQYSRTLNIAAYRQTTLAHAREAHRGIRGRSGLFDPLAAGVDLGSYDFGKLESDRMLIVTHMAQRQLTARTRFLEAKEWLLVEENAKLREALREKDVSKETLVESLAKQDEKHSEELREMKAEQEKAAAEKQSENRRETDLLRQMIVDLSLEVRQLRNQSSGANVSSSRFFKNAGDSEEKIPQIEGLTHQALPGGGHCLYYAVGLYLNMDVTKLRRQVADHIEADIKKGDSVYPQTIQTFEEERVLRAQERKEREIKPVRTVAEYIEAVRSGNEWGDNLELAVLMKVFDRPIIVALPDGTVRNASDAELFKGEPIFVYYNGRDHYDALLLDKAFEDGGRDLLASLPGGTKKGMG